MCNSDTDCINNFMDYAFSKGLYDSEGCEYDDGLFIFIGSNTVIRFKDVDELEKFANRILKSLPEIRGDERY